MSDDVAFALIMLLAFLLFAGEPDVHDRLIGAGCVQQAEAPHEGQ